MGIVEAVEETVSSTGPNDSESIDITVSQDPQGVEAGSTPHLMCRTTEPAGHMWWSAKGKNLTSVKEPEFVERFDLKKASRQDSGNYTCNAMIKDRHVKKTIYIRVIGECVFNRKVFF